MGKGEIVQLILVFWDDSKINHGGTETRRNAGDKPKATPKPKPYYRRHGGKTEGTEKRNKRSAKRL
jgi:hypothetical protein